MLVDGKKVAEEVLKGLERERKHFGALKLGLVMEGGDAATESFVKIKSRIAERLKITTARYSPQEMSKAIKECDGIIVQLPIAHDAELLAKLPPGKDIDGLSKKPVVRPPVAEAICEIFDRCNIAARGKHAVVVGAGRLVGAPAAELLRDLGAKVEVVTEHDSLEPLHFADIVVLGAGKPGLIEPDMLHRGVVLIDAGTSEQGGKVKGDARPSCANVASVFTPVPGGVGPIAVAMIFKNLFVLARRNKK